MLKFIVKIILKMFGVDINIFIQRISAPSIKLALKESRRDKLVERLRSIEPDISRQYSHTTEFNDYWELKLRAQHAFQCSIMLKAIEGDSCDKLTVVDIGDSAGTHMRYLSELVKDRFRLNTISVNLDPIAIEKIKSRGQEAILCRAEELNFENNGDINLFTTFQMVEHLHNPALFFRTLAKKSYCNRIVVTVPYVRISRVGLYSIRRRFQKPVFAEDEHIFELSPADWQLLMLHSGWKVIHSEIYYQYPRKIPLISQLLRIFWRETDFEGFLGFILEKDTSFSDYYQDWQDQSSRKKTEELHAK